MDKTVFAIARWAARLLSLISIVLLILFFVGEGFNPNRVSGRQWLGLAFFPTGITAGMILGWRWELAGGSITLISLGLFYLVGFSFEAQWPGGWAFLAFASPGILFLIISLAQRAISPKKGA